MVVLVVIVVGTGFLIYKESGITVVSDFSIITLEITLLILIINIVISNYITFTMSRHYFSGLVRGFFGVFF